MLRFLGLQILLKTLAEEAIQKGHAVKTEKDGQERRQKWITDSRYLRGKI
jgi:hypothetical protein